MVEKISVEIGLEGGDEVTRQLEQIGQAGQKTFSDIQGAAEQVDFSAISDDLQEVGNTGQEAFDKIKTAVQNAAVFEQIIQGVKKVEGAFEALGAAATKMASRMTRSLGPLGVFARALGPVGIAAGVLGTLFVKSESEISGAINGLLVSATKLGLAVSEFDKLRQALLQTGASADAVVPGLATFQQKLADMGFAPAQVTQQLQNLIARLEQMPDGVKRNTLAFEMFDAALGASIIAGLQTGTLSAENFATALSSVTPVTQEQIIQAAKYQQAINALSNAWTQFKGAVSAPLLTPALEFLTTQIPGIQAGIATTVREFQALGSAINTVATTGAAVISALADPIKLVANEVASLIGTFSGWNWSIVDAGVAAWNALTGAIQNAINKVMEFIGLKPTGPVPAAGAPGMAGGGLLGGSGTGTSDSNLAWVSRGEYITPARAVQQPGVLSFLEALRSSGGNLSRVLNGMGRFALGGLVPRPMAIPAYAAGGLVRGNNVTIQFPGLPPIGGLRASSEVVGQLQKAAALAQVRSGGRKPSRYS